MTAETEEQSLSAPGRNDATIYASGNRGSRGPDRDEGFQPVLEADVAHVVAHEERDDEGGHADDDEVNEDFEDDEEEDFDVHMNDSHAIAEGVIDDY